MVAYGFPSLPRTTPPAGCFGGEPLLGCDAVGSSAMMLLLSRAKHGRGCETSHSRDTNSEARLAGVPTG